MELKIDDVCFSYPSKEVLKNITFEAHSGEILGIIGQNGCGKTTLLKCLNTTLSATDGCITIDGQDVLSMTKKKIAQEMGFVTQTTSTTFPFTVFETVMMGRYSRKQILEGESSDDVRIVYDALKDAGALEFADRDIDELSGGERRRVMIARALVQEPRILLLDEPTLHLDINHQFDLMDLISDLAKNKSLLIVLVTHDLILAARYCDRVIAVEHGEIVAMGETGDTLTPDLMRQVFDIDAEISIDPRVGLNVTILGKHKR